MSQLAEWSSIKYLLSWCRRKTTQKRLFWLSHSRRKEWTSLFKSDLLPNM